MFKWIHYLKSSMTHDVSSCEYFGSG